MKDSKPKVMRVVVRGAGEMASGVIHRLFKSDFEVIALEKLPPTCVRRTVCFAEALLNEQVAVETVTARMVYSIESAVALAPQLVPIFLDPDATLLPELKPAALIDARMLKREADCSLDLAPIVIGLGPGFIAGQNCHAVVETNRGDNLGRVIYEGVPEPHTGVPAKVNGIDRDRVLRAANDGLFAGGCEIGDTVVAGDLVGWVEMIPVRASIGGIVRGLLRTGVRVTAGMKIGDIDPRGERDRCYRISDKANAIAAGVLEALGVLSKDIL